MLKKYGFIMLLLLGLCGVRGALASCAFTTPTGTNIEQTMASSPVTAVMLTSTNLQQLFQSSLLAGGPIISTCNPSTGSAITVSGDTFSTASLSETMPDGGLLLGTGTSANGFGYGFWYTVTYGDGSGSVSGHLKKGGMFSATPAQLNGARWEFQAELWYAGGYYSDRVKASQIAAVNTTYFRVGFSNAMKGVFFNSPAIPITPTTCNLSIDRSKVDFGSFNFLLYGGTGGVKNGPYQEISVSNNNCKMTTKIETRILSNGNPVSSDQHLLLNKLAGDDAASGFGVALYTFYNPLIIDALSGNGDIRGPFTSAPKEFDTSGPIYLYLEPDGTPLRNGKFEATATINVSYY